MSVVRSVAGLRDQAARLQPTRRRQCYRALCFAARGSGEIWWLSHENEPRFCAAARHLGLSLLYLLSVGCLLRLRQRRAAQNLHHGHHHRHSHRNHLHHLLCALPGLQLPRQVSCGESLSVVCGANSCRFVDLPAVVPRLMMCKTVQATPPVGHSVVQESSSSSQGAFVLNGAARREMEVNVGITGKKAADSNELERLFIQHDLQNTSIVS